MPQRIIALGTLIPFNYRAHEAEKAHIKRQVWAIWGSNCFYCGVFLSAKKSKERPDRETEDHVIPKCKGGQRSILNIVPCCLACNRDKADMDLEQYRQYCVWKQNAKNYRQKNYVVVKNLKFYGERQPLWKF